MGSQLPVPSSKKYNTFDDSCENKESFKKQQGLGKHWVIVFTEGFIHTVVWTACYKRVKIALDRTELNLQKVLTHSTGSACAKCSPS